MDNDCDGRVDEMLSRPCGGAMMGVCKQGTEECAGGTWTPCQGAVEPGTETCDAEGLDENCNGTANEGCDCTPGMTRACGVMKGICRQGMQSCNDAGKWDTECVGATEPMTETCDGRLDEDCDGRVDNGCSCTNGESRDCQSAASGDCKPGTQMCVEGRWGTCESKQSPGRETCDGRDNDCDGTKDNNSCPDGKPCIGSGSSYACGECSPGETRPCGPPEPVRGECKRGVNRCVNGKFSSTCEGAILPATERECDGEDSDCDGNDEECTNSSISCDPSLKRCLPGGSYKGSCDLSSCRVSGNTLSCRCFNGGSTANCQSSVNFASCPNGVSQFHGALTCGGQPEGCGPPGPDNMGGTAKP